MIERSGFRRLIDCTFATVVVLGVGCGGSTATTGLDPTDGGLADGAVLDGGSPPEAGPGGTTAGIPCGSVSCPTTGAICCAYATTGSATGYSYLCVGGATCPVGDAGGGGAQTPTVLSCTGAANCAAGTRCCVHHNQDNQGSQSSTSTCKPICSAGEAQLCDPLASASGCAADATCSSKNIDKWEFPSTFATCGGVAPPQ